MAGINSNRLRSENALTEEIKELEKNLRELKINVQLNTGVTSAFGRAGAVVATANDYTLQQINKARTPVNDAAYPIVTTDFIVAYTAISTGRTATLPLASSMTRQLIIVKDESGNAGTNNITVARTSPDTIDGATSKVINSAYGVLRLYSNGTNWFTI